MLLNDMAFYRWQRSGYDIFFIPIVIIFVIDAAKPEKTFFRYILKTDNTTIKH